MMVVVVMVVRMAGAGVLQLSFRLQPILLGMSLRTTFLQIDGVCLLGHLVLRRLSFGFILGCVFVFLHGESPVMFMRISLGKLCFFWLFQTFTFVSSYKR